MKNYLFAFTISLLSIGYSCKSDSTNVAVAPTPTIQAAAFDTPPPTPEVDPDYQEDQSGPKPSDTIVGNTGFSRRQLDSIAKHKSGPVEYLGGKGTAKPHDLPKQK